MKRLQVVIVNRLVLSLSHAGNAKEETEFRTRTGRSAPVFSSDTVVGNIGAPIRTLSDETLYPDNDYVSSKRNGNEYTGIDDLEAHPVELIEDHFKNSSVQTKHPHAAEYESCVAHSDWRNKDLPARPLSVDS